MTALTLGAVWVLAATATAFLPMRRQMIPGLALLIAAPILLIWIGYAHGWMWVAFGTFAFVSMFRRPLRYFALKAMGRDPGPAPR
ncbi:MAG: DUF2484 family protein [Pseudorhodobacter sp.]|nr:MAG: DUF2484 family protein [Pseudorhodobacter sp.]